MRNFNLFLFTLAIATGCRQPGDVYYVTEEGDEIHNHYGEEDAATDEACTRYVHTNEGFVVESSTGLVLLESSYTDNGLDGINWELQLKVPECSDQGVRITSIMESIGSGDPSNWLEGFYAWAFGVDDEGFNTVYGPGISIIAHVPDGPDHGKAIQTYSWIDWEGWNTWWSGSRPDFYVAPGQEVTIRGSNLWDDQDGTVDEPEWNERTWTLHWLKWTPANTQDFESDTVDKLSIPTSAWEMNQPIPED